MSSGNISINIFSAQIQSRIDITCHVFTEQRFFTLSAKIDTDLQRQNIIKYDLWWVNQRLNLITNNANVEKPTLTLKNNLTQFKAKKTLRLPTMTGTYNPPYLRHCTISVS